MNTKKRFFTTYDLILGALFVALIIVGAFIKIPIGPVPITLQFMFVLFAGQILRPLVAMVSILIYTFLGLIGLPVFSGGGGPGYILTPTFGYILGFILAIIIVSKIAHSGKTSLLRLILANLIGFIIVYIIGLGYYVLLSFFYFKNLVDLGVLLLTGFVVFIPTDLVFCVITAIIAKRIKPVLAVK